MCTSETDHGVALPDPFAVKCINPSARFACSKVNFLWHPGLEQQ
jgi:hypothetical protein